MILYLVQHGLAKSKDEDSLRPLSADGREQSRRVAEHAGRLNLSFDVIEQSGKLRAKETAEIFAEILEPPHGIRVAEGLLPKDDASLWQSRLEEEGPNRMLVGHLPHLSNLASLLLAGNKEHPLVSFKNSGILCLERGAEPHWSVRWMITPEVLLQRSAMK